MYMDKTSTRYPFTYACDFIRSLPDKADKFGATKLSRREVSLIMAKVAEALGMTNTELACKIADKFCDEEEY